MDSQREDMSTANEEVMMQSGTKGERLSFPSAAAVRGASSHLHIDRQVYERGNIIFSLSLIFARKMEKLRKTCNISMFLCTSVGCGGEKVMDKILVCGCFFRSRFSLFPVLVFAISLHEMQEDGKLENNMHPEEKRM
jgi:hypothetical protein